MLVIQKQRRKFIVIGLMFAVVVALLIGAAFTASRGHPESGAEATQVAASQKMITTNEVVEERAAIPYETRRVDDATMPIGQSTAATKGKDGVMRFLYSVTKVNGKITDRQLLSKEVVEPPVHEVLKIGTLNERNAVLGTAAPVAPPPPATPAPQCDVNYSGGCVPIASDVDCDQATEDGPAYAPGAVTVSGVDVYGLDPDLNGIGCG